MVGHPVHASCVAVDGQGVLLRGPSGSGKSDLAIRLIDQGAVLVADDQVDTENVGGRLLARPPETLAGRIEARGIGIVEGRPWREAPVFLVVDLVAPDAVERLPDPASCTIDGVDLPRIALAPFEASAPAKIRLALASLEAVRRPRDSIAQP